MATQTPVRKRKGPAPQSPRKRNARPGKTASVPTRKSNVPTRKPKTFRQWAGKRASKWMGRHWSTRAVRGAYRLSTREAQGIRDRRAARKTNQAPNVPSRRSILAGKFRDRRDALKTRLNGHTHCAGCGQNFTSPRQWNEHACAQNHGPKASAPVPRPAKNPTPASTPAPPPSSPTAAGMGAMGAAMAAAATGKVGQSNAMVPPTPPGPPMQGRSPDAQELGPNHAKSMRKANARQWRKANAKERKETMPAGKRATDRMGRELGALTGATIACYACGWKLHPGEDHDCQGTDRQAAAQGQGSAAGQPSPPPAPQSPAAAPPTPTPPAPKTDNKSTSTTTPAPNGGGSQGKGAAMAAPTAPATAQPTGGGGSAGHATAAALVQAKAAWGQEVPEFHSEMIVKMNATREAYAKMSAIVQEHAGILVKKGFHPETVAPLITASAGLLEGANHYTTMIMAFERVYAQILAHYRSGIPDPGEKYLSDGRRTAGN